MDPPSFQTPPPHLEALGSLVPSLPCMEKNLVEKSYLFPTLNITVCTCTRSPPQIVSTDCMYQVPVLSGSPSKSWQNSHLLIREPRDWSLLVPWYTCSTIVRHQKYKFWDNLVTDMVSTFDICLGFYLPLHFLTHSHAPKPNGIIMTTKLCLWFAEPI